MKNRAICLYFQVHQPFRLRTYRFFDIGNKHDYFDEYANRYILRKVAQKCYLPANNILLDLINEFGKAFKLSFSISGSALDQFEMYAPEVLESFQQLAETNCVEFLAETNAHSLSSLHSKSEFFKQVEAHSKRVSELFNQKPQTFRNTELIYSDLIGESVAEMGFKTMLTEGAKHVLGWKSPNYMYCNALNPKLKVLLKNFRLSDDIAFRFSNKAWAEWPLTAEKYTNWLNMIDADNQVVNLFMDYETFGEHQWEETGIFDFLRALPKQIFQNTNYKFLTPSELSGKLQPVSSISVPYPISWADEERDLTAWLGNVLQDEAFNKLYKLENDISGCNDESIQKDWLRLQNSDHFYYMCTKWFSDGEVHKYFNPYKSPYEAFINYMNVIADLTIRIKDNKITPQTLSSKDIKETDVDKKTELKKETVKKRNYKRKIKMKRKTKTTSKEKIAKIKGNFSFNMFNELPQFITKEIMKDVDI